MGGRNALGWVLREIGKRNGLSKFCHHAPRARGVVARRASAAWPSRRCRRLSSQQGEALGAEPRTKADKIPP